MRALRTSTARSSFGRPAWGRKFSRRSTNFPKSKFPSCGSCTANIPQPLRFPHLIPWQTPNRVRSADSPLCRQRYPFLKPSVFLNDDPPCVGWLLHCRSLDSRGRPSLLAPSIQPEIHRERQWIRRIFRNVWILHDEASLFITSFHPP